MKVCTKCGVEKPPELFGKVERLKDGRDTRCKACVRIYYASWREAHKDDLAEKARAWRAANIERVTAAEMARRVANSDKIKAAGRAKYLRDGEKMRARQRDYQKENRDKGSARSSRWNKKNRPKVNIIRAARRACQEAATPSWADKDQMLCFYQLVPLLDEETGIKHNVDHIVPLVSKIVCGLHCQDNLRVIPRFENMSKGNRWWPDMPSAA